MVWWLLLLVPATFVYLFGVQVVTEWLDRRRIADHLAAEGSELDDLDPSLFGPGAAGSRWERRYAVRFRDRAGNPITKSFGTSLFGGVYPTEDVEGPVRLDLPPGPRGSSRG